jgi:hypothetical protein
MLLAGGIEYRGRAPGGGEYPLTANARLRQLDEIAASAISKTAPSRVTEDVKGDGATACGRQATTMRTSPVRMPALKREIMSSSSFSGELMPVENHAGLPNGPERSPPVNRC